MTKRVYELANELKVDSKKVLEKMESLGIAAKNHMSVIEEKDVSRVKDELIKGKSKIEEKKTILAPNGKPLPMGKPMPKAAVPQKKATDEEEKAEDVIKEVKEEPKAAPPQEKKSQEKEAAVQPVKELEAKAPAAEKAEKPEEKKVEEKKAEEPADVFYYDGRPAPQKLKIVKTNAQVIAEEETRKKEQEALRKKQEEERKAQAAERRQSQDRGPRQGQGQDRGPRQGQGQDRGPRQGQGQDRGPRPGGQGQDRGPRQGQGQDRGPRQGQGQGQDRGPRQGQGQGQDRGPRQGQGQDRGPRPGQGQGQGRPGQGQGRPGQGQGQGRPGQGQGQGRPGQGQGQGRGPAKTGSDTATGMEKPSRVKKTKDKEPGKKEAFSNKKSTPYKPLDLTKSAPKKHRKRQDKQSDAVEENLVEMEAMPAGTKVVTVPITVAGFSEQIEKSTSQVIMALMKLGVMANINQNLDEETVVLLGAELGVNIVVGKVYEDVVEEGLELFEDKEEDLRSRPPIITVMGHVDHGKTSLLDAIRKTNITDKEAGGITQHIGASEVELNGQRIVFLDTPGHEAFTAMRARGAHVTDIAILVVAADDSVKPQTIESISHAKAAGVPIIVAVNKMDKPGADPDRVKKDLTEHGILVEEWGGDTICVPVSAKSGEGIVNLLEMILLQAEVLELKANPNRLAMGTVIEARLDKAKGPVTTLLVLNGTLEAGMSVVAGTSSGRIRAMTNFKGDTITKAGPATAVEILGLTEVPEAGDEFNAVKEDKMAREIAENRRIKLREEVMAKNSSVTLEQLFSQIEEGEVKELNLIIKADVQGSVGALTASLEKLKNENVVVKIIHTGVGTVTESDVMLASTSNAIIIGFNVRPSTAVTTMADRDGVEIRTYRIIYEAIEHIEAAMKGMLDPVFKEVVMGKIEVRETFKVPNIGIIAGAYVLEGKVQRNAQVRLVRDGIVIHEGKISSLRRFKDDVREVATGYECGIGIENYNDLKLGDIIEAFKMEEIERK